MHRLLFEVACWLSRKIIVLLLSPKLQISPNLHFGEITYGIIWRLSKSSTSKYIKPNDYKFYSLTFFNIHLPHLQTSKPTIRPTETSSTPLGFPTDFPRAHRLGRAHRAPQRRAAGHRRAGGRQAPGRRASNWRKAWQNFRKWRFLGFTWIYLFWNVFVICLVFLCLSGTSMLSMFLSLSMRILLHCNQKHEERQATTILVHYRKNLGASGPSLSNSQTISNNNPSRKALCLRQKGKFWSLLCDR